MPPTHARACVLSQMLRNPKDHFCTSKPHVIQYWDIILYLCCNWEKATKINRWLYSQLHLNRQQIRRTKQKLKTFLTLNIILNRLTHVIKNQWINRFTHIDRKMLLYAEIYNDHNTKAGRIVPAWNTTMHCVTRHQHQLHNIGELISLFTSQLPHQSAVQMNLIHHKILYTNCDIFSRDKCMHSYAILVSVVCIRMATNLAFCRMDVL